jgi:hypothetical protein
MKVKWFVRLALLILVCLAAMRARQSSNQVIGNYSFIGDDGRLRVVMCRPFDYELCKKNDEELASRGYPRIPGMNSDDLQNDASEYQTHSFLWGGASLLSCIGILFTFRKPSKTA